MRTDSRLGGSDCTKQGGPIARGQVRLSTAVLWTEAEGLVTLAEEPHLMTDNGNLPLFQPTPLQRRLINAAVEIEECTPDTVEFLHAVLCQVGLPAPCDEGADFRAQQWPRQHPGRGRERCTRVGGGSSSRYPAGRNPVLR